MSLSIAAMSLAELTTFLEANAAYTTLASAFSGLNLVITEGVGATGTAIAVTGGPAATAIGTVGETALELAATAQLQATGTGVTTSGIGLLQGETTFSAAGLLSMEVGTVAAAVAPLLGVSLGSDLYQANPRLWNKISETLLPFCYDGTIQMPAWVAKVGEFYEVSVSKGIIEALKSLFEEEGIPMADSPSAGYVSDLDISPATMPVPAGATGMVETQGGVIIYNYYFPVYKYGTSIPSYICIVVGNSADDHVAYVSAYDTSTGTETLGYAHTTSSYTYNNKTVYYVTKSVSTGLRNGTGVADITPNSLSPEKRGMVAWTVKYGTHVSPGEYQPGTSEWEGNVPSQLPESRPAVVGVDPVTGQAVTQPMVPIAPPYPIIIIPDPIVEPEPEIIPFPWPEPEQDPHTEPWPEIMPWPLPEEQPDWWPAEIPYPYKYPVPQPSVDPDISPDPDTVTDPDEQIKPYIRPLPIPWKVIDPTIEDIVDPLVDPSQPLPPSPPTTADPPIDTEPPPEGLSPWPAIPTTPLPFSSGGGLVTVYHPTAQQLYDFEMWLWVTLSQASVDTVWNNPFDGVITLFELYCTPTDAGTRTIHSGFLDSGITSNVISRYTEIDCGTIGIPEYYGNYFDYSPYSKAHIYLPFIGIQELNVDDIVGHCVNVTYRIDEYNGACIAMITVAKVTEVNGEDVEYSNTMYQFCGNCSVELPIAGGSQAQIKAGLMMADATRQAAQGMAGLNLVGGLASLLFGSVGGAIGGLTSSLGGLASGELSALGHMLSGKSSVQKSGSFGSSHGALGIKTPYIVITRPKQIQVPDYEKLYGFPAHKMVKIRDCTGFIRCREVHVISPTANDEEKTMIEQLLKAGVYVS